MTAADSTAPRGGEPVITVTLNREQAYTASAGLVEQLADRVANLAHDLEGAPSGRVASKDAESSAAHAVRVIDAINRIGWPHRHAWELCEFAIDPTLEDVTMWPESPPARLEELETNAPPAATVGDRVAVEIPGDLVEHVVEGLRGEMEGAATDKPELDWRRLRDRIRHCGEILEMLDAQPAGSSVRLALGPCQARALAAAVDYFNGGLEDDVRRAEDAAEIVRLARQLEQLRAFRDAIPGAA